MNFKNKITTLILMVFCSLTSMAQVGIGTTTPNANAALDVLSTSQGILLPRMTTAQRDAIASPAKGLTIFNTNLNCIQTNIGTTSTPNWKCFAGQPSSNGTAVISAYTCSTASAGILKVETPVSGVTQTITATVTTAGTYSISTTANGVTFAASGTFAGTGAQNIVLTATGTPTAKGSNTYTLNTTPNCNFSRYASVTACYARISTSPDVFKDFLCHNLGADISLDPNTPVVGLQGAYIQWGRRGPNTTGDARVDWQTAANTANFAAAPTSGNANAGAVSGWSTSAAADNAWRTSGGAKTADDPCPSGYRVPTSAEWTGVNTNNTASRTGTFSNNANNYGVALHYGYGINASTKTLTLPATGYRFSNDGALGLRGDYGWSWSSTENTSAVLALYFTSGGVVPASGGNGRTFGIPVRCIEVDNPSSNGTAVVSGYTCNTASAGTMTTGTAVSGVTQTITATVTTVGTYGITATANGVTFTATGTFAGTGAQDIVLTATGTHTAVGTNSFTLNTTPNCSFNRTTLAHPSSNGTAVVSAYTCSTASAGTMTAGVAVSGVTQTITATVTTVGTYSISTTANGVTFSGSGTFAGTGSQAIVLTATGTPTSATASPYTYTLNTTPTCSFTRAVCGTSVTFTYNGASVTYGIVASSGKCWLDRNLGATQVATSSTDHLSYGDLFQWGRGADGHQLITWTNSTTGTAVNASISVLSGTDVPGNANFIKINSGNYDWRSPQNVNLWQGPSGTNNPCPSGFRLPTDVELLAERASWGTSNAAGAITSPLKLPLSSGRISSSGSPINIGTIGYYWSSTVSGILSRYLAFASGYADMYNYYRAEGYAVRCLKD